MGTDETRTSVPAAEEARPRRGRRALLAVGVVALLALVTAELVLNWSSLVSAMAHLRTPHPGWLAAAVAVELASMGAYARMQHRLLRSAGVRVSIQRHIALAYAAHSLSVTLPGGAAFSTRFNYQQMRRFGASPAVASWCIALSGLLSAAALAAVTAAAALTGNGSLRWGALACLTAAALLVIIGVRHLTRHPAALEPAARVTLALVNRLRRRPKAEGLDRVRHFTRQLRAAHLTPAQAAAAAAHAILNWLLDALCLGLCFLAVGGGAANPAQLLLAYCAGMAAATITVIPGGLGIIDTALILGLVTAGVDTPAAIATVVLYRIISFGFVIGTGWITWLVIRRRTSNQPTPA